MDDVINRFKQNLGELLKLPGLRFDAELSKRLPKEPGLYRIYEKGKAGKTIYIGKSKSLHRRIINDHFRGDKIASTLKRKLIKNSGFANEKEVENYLVRKCLVQFILIKEQALLARIEHFAIAVLSPKWND